MYNLSFLENVTGTAQFVEGLNNLTGGWLIGAIMIAAFMVSFMVFYGRVGVGEILLGNGLIFSILTVLLNAAGLVGDWVIGLPVALSVIGFLILIMDT